MSKPLNIPESFSITENLKFEYSFDDSANMLSSCVAILAHVPMFHGGYESNTVMLVSVARWNTQPKLAIEKALQQLMDKISTVCYSIQAQYSGDPILPLALQRFNSHFDHAKSIRREAQQALGDTYTDRRQELIDAIFSEVNAITEAA